LTNVIPLPRPPAAALQRHLVLLGREIDSYADLVPLDQLPALRREIEERLRPAKRSEVAAFVAMLMGQTNIGSGIRDPEAYGQGMAEELELAGYPTNILKEAVEQVRRDPGWFSTPAMVTACEALVKPWRKRLAAIAQMEAEHTRRQQDAAERAAWAEREAQRAQDDQRRRQCLLAQARERLGDDAGDIELADSLSPAEVDRGGESVSWLEALAQGEPWAAEYCRRMALAERVRRALEEGRVCPDEAFSITKLIATHEERARRQIADMRDRPPEYRGDIPLPGFWLALWSIRRACGCDLPRDVVLPEDQAAALKRLDLSALADVRAVIDRQSAQEWAAKRAAKGWLVPAPPQDEQ
jgi:hypothetical protein